MSFELPAHERIAALLGLPADSPDITQLTPDASTREFFRVPWQGKTAIACAYPEPFDNTLPQIDVTRLFLACELPVAPIFSTDFASGILVHEDFGDEILRHLLDTKAAGEEQIDAAISLIARIQAGTYKAFESGSIASKLKFDEEKLLWELNFFKSHYFESLLHRTLDAGFDTALAAEFVELSRELETVAAVLVHRDYHAANLMVFEGRLRIIDHQDARIGSAAYDLVSLLLDRITEPPQEDWISEKKEFLQNQRTVLGLERAPGFDYEFELVTIQRCLKAIGTFSNQTANFGKSHYLKYIRPMFEVTRNACIRLERFPVIAEMAGRESQE